MTFTLSLPTARYATAADRLRAYEDVERRLREQPGVQAAGAVSTLALRGYTWSGDATVEGRAATDYERDAAPQVGDARLLQGHGHQAAGRADVQ